jgi:hypothetical protein
MSIIHILDVGLRPEEARWDHRDVVVAGITAKDDASVKNVQIYNRKTSMIFESKLGNKQKHQLLGFAEQARWQRYEGDLRKITAEHQQKRHMTAIQTAIAARGWY